MEFLKAEINRKRKLNETLREKIASADGAEGESAQSPAEACEPAVTTKYIRLKDRMKLEEMELLEKQRRIDEERRQRQQKEMEATRVAVNKTQKEAAVAMKAKEDERNQQLDATFAMLSENDVKIRLRMLGQPVTLFGESSSDRLARLTEVAKRNLSEQMNNLTSNAEKEFRVGRNASIDEQEEAELEAEDAADTANVAQQAEMSDDDGQEGNEGDQKHGAAGSSGLKWDPSVHFTKMDLPREKKVYKFFRALLKQWESDLDLRDDSEKRTAKGKLETRTQKQCKDHIRPLFRMLKSKQVPVDIMEKLLLMVEYAEQGNFVAANDQYMIAAIGKAAWPIGLTMVGIHERSGREKISTSKVAHVMNNELERKYLTSVKRLLTFAQSKRPDIPPSMKVLTR